MSWLDPWGRVKGKKIQGGNYVAVDSLFIVAPIFSAVFFFCNVVLSDLSSFAIISPRKRELVATF